MIKNTPAFDQNTPEMNKKPAGFQLFEERISLSKKDSYHFNFYVYLIY